MPANCTSCRSGFGVDSETKYEQPRKDSLWCVIGAGASGLIVMKELNEIGVKTICYDTLPRIGGVYAKSYDNTLLTTSSLLTAYSSYSDGKEESPVFWTDEQYLNYLDGFAAKFELLKNIKFRTAVLKVKKCRKSGKWMVTTKGGAAVAAHRTYGPGYPEDPDVPEETVAFDGIAICTGTNNWPCLPRFEGQEKFKGTITHSDDLRSVEHYRGKRVLIIGAGESGSDICNEISKVASKTCMVIRGKHGHLIPRRQSNGRVTDLNTNRLRYSNPHILGTWIGWTNQQAKRLQAMLSNVNSEEETKVLKHIAALNIEQQTSAFTKFGCKNAGFVEAMVLRGAELHRVEEFCLEDKRVVFPDGSSFECDEIVACTGYRNVFPFLEEHHPDLAFYFGCNPRKLYKHIFPPSYNGEVAYFGFARPAFGSLPPTAEMQARLLACVLNGEVQLPSCDDMERVAREDAEMWNARFAYDAPRVKGLVDFQVYTDDLASLIGALPPLRKIFRENPKLWFKIMFGPFTMHQYRLVGPRAQPEAAKEVMLRHPTGDVLESSITASFLVAAKTLSLMGFKSFTPNNF